MSEENKVTPNGTDKRQTQVSKTDSPSHSGQSSDSDLTSNKTVKVSTEGSVPMNTIGLKSNDDKMANHCNKFESLIYYERRVKGPIHRPMAVLFGFDWSLATVQPKDRETYVTNKGFIHLEQNITDLDMRRHITEVKHSKDLIVITTKSGSSVMICGETGTDGLIINYQSMVKIRGILLICENQCFQPLESGRHTIENLSGDQIFIICDENTVLLIGDKNNYLIDDESYLDLHIKQLIPSQIEDESNSSVILTVSPVSKPEDKND